MVAIRVIKLLGTLELRVTGFLRWTLGEQSLCLLCRLYYVAVLSLDY